MRTRGEAPKPGEQGGVVQVGEDVPREQVALGHVRVAGQEKASMPSAWYARSLASTWSGSPTMAAPAPDRARPIPVHS